MSGASIKIRTLSRPSRGASRSKKSRQRPGHRRLGRAGRADFLRRSFRRFPAVGHRHRHSGPFQKGDVVIAVAESEDLLPSDAKLCRQRLGGQGLVRLGTEKLEHFVLGVDDVEPALIFVLELGVSCAIRSAAVVQISFCKPVPISAGMSAMGT